MESKIFFSWLIYIFSRIYAQHVQVLKMEESWPSSMDKAHVREGPHPIKKASKVTVPPN